VLQVAALRQCKNEAPQVVHVEADPLATTTVYVPAPYNDTVASISVAAAAAVGGVDAAALAAEIKELKSKLGHKDEILRVRNNQLAETNRLLDERESLWNASLARVLPCCLKFQSAHLKSVW
jgi:hypothetical protein